jgi:predicted DNA-binding transcriptional regulator AlpA
MTDHELIGISGVADLLDITRQGADFLSKRADFPAPAHRLPTGRLWVRSEIEAWNQARLAKRGEKS